MRPMMVSRVSTCLRTSRPTMRLPRWSPRQRTSCRPSCAATRRLLRRMASRGSTWRKDRARTGRHAHRCGRTVLRTGPTTCTRRRSTGGPSRTRRTTLSPTLIPQPPPSRTSSRRCPSGFRSTRAWTRACMQRRARRVALAHTAARLPQGVRTSCRGHLRSTAARRTGEGRLRRTQSSLGPPAPRRLRAGLLRPTPDGQTPRHTRAVSTRGEAWRLPRMPHACVGLAGGTGGGMSQVLAPLACA
mmetsp:Transcript_33061/g.98264  ORF Transcript_33061/g.98264 Transcript_33061/m.98264 type:complete len:244 (+) Transcript_33061:823-1554(+)